jgi:regulator of chromosome condensation
LVPTEIVDFRGKDIIDITGGEHHSVALEAGGAIYTFGRNDDGQIGLGEEINEELKVKA